MMSLPLEKPPRHGHLIRRRYIVDGKDSLPNLWVTL
ncbi:hypothetical protein C8E00_10759 [Chromohalobacter marismortui]|uniref:Uncharacterized protein n=1 Tax=Chromohalobacter marismortui TaxID=42055 RepID=A0A4R7NIU4_9GAMM|nr:hypothetical protein C8E00_10759 [Chromohalobacter marismortui]